MVITWYKKLFSINVQYQTTGASSQAGVLLEPSDSTLLLLEKHNMRYRMSPGQIEIFVAALQTGTSAALTPLFPLDTNELLFFKLNFSDHSLPGKLKFFADTASQDLGFPLLYTGTKTTSSSAAVALHYEKTKVLPGIGSYLVKASDAGLSSTTYTTFNLSDRNGKIVVSAGTFKNSDGYFSCSWDLHLASTGIYTLEIGSLSKTVFIDTKNEFTNALELIQITRTEKVKYPSTINSSSFVNFTQTIQKL